MPSLRSEVPDPEAFTKVQIAHHLECAPDDLDDETAVSGHVVRLIMLALEDKQSEARQGEAKPREHAEVWSLRPAEDYTLGDCIGLVRKYIDDNCAS